MITREQLENDCINPTSEAMVLDYVANELELVPDIIFTTHNDVLGTVKIFEFEDYVYKYLLLAPMFCAFSEKI